MPRIEPALGCPCSALRAMPIAAGSERTPGERVLWGVFRYGECGDRREGLVAGRLSHAFVRVDSHLP